MKPADLMMDAELKDGWKVVARLTADLPNFYAGGFSTCYQVEKGGQIAFLKAMDLHDAASDVNSPEAIKRQMNMYAFERDIANECKSFDKIVTVITDGVHNEHLALEKRVFYIIFETASNNVKSFLTTMQDVDLYAIFSICHASAVGIQQLHSADIVHQDLKAANVLVFDSNSLTTRMEHSPRRKSNQEGQYKIADLGRASKKDTHSHIDGYPVAGDGRFSPIELMYGYTDNDWHNRRQLCDLYMLGNMLYFMFDAISINYPIMNCLPKDLRPKFFGGSYQGSYANVRASVVTAFDQTLLTFENAKHNQFSSDAVQIIRYCCYPVPERRSWGNALNTPAKATIEKVIARFDMIRGRIRANALIGKN